VRGSVRANPRTIGRSFLPPKNFKADTRWRPGANARIAWRGPSGRFRAPGGGWRPGYAWVSGFRPEWYGRSWRRDRPWLHGNGWYSGTSIVGGLFGIAAFLLIVNAAAANDTEYVEVPQAPNTYLIPGSVYGADGYDVSFNYVRYGEEYSEVGNCQSFTLGDGEVPQSRSMANVLNGACSIAYGN
jgi:hypothetical protein